MNEEGSGTELFVKDHVEREDFPRIGDEVWNDIVDHVLLVELVEVF